MKVLITGSDGFIGKNLIARLRGMEDIEIYTLHRNSTKNELLEYVGEADFIFHLAGANRPANSLEFSEINIKLTYEICAILEQVECKTGKKPPLIFTSSSQASLKNLYGQSKREAEKILEKLFYKLDYPIKIIRLPNVFGKWSRPYYNSVVATFCYNIANNLPIQINDPDTQLELVYIDDVIDCFLGFLLNFNRSSDVDACYELIEGSYKATVGDIANQIYSFKVSRGNLTTEPVGHGLCRALYSTYLSFLPEDEFIYSLNPHVDARGSFVEMLKTKDSGQFSFFTAFPSVVRGGHFHHSKVEKFLVISGKARFRFKHILTGDAKEFIVSGSDFMVVETIPGWTHDITNIGDDILLVMLWANEIFNPKKPDTFAFPL